MGDLAYALAETQGPHWLPPKCPQNLAPFTLPRRPLVVQGDQLLATPGIESLPHCLDPEVVRGRIPAHLSH